MRLLLLLALLVGTSLKAEERLYHGLTPFDMQAFVAAERMPAQLLNAGQLPQAIAAFDQLVAQYPKVPRVHINRGIALALGGQNEAAMKAFETGAGLGFERFDKVAGITQLQGFLKQPRMQALLAGAPADPGPEVIFAPAVPAVAKDRRIVVRAENIDYLAQSDVLLVRTQFPKRPWARHVASGEEPWVGVINRLHARGAAAGNHGDIYENRDGDHSLLDMEQFAQMTRMVYAPDIDAKHKLSRGINLRVITDAITIGNSSTAFESGPMWRSLVRHAMTSPGGAQALFTQHRANQIYIYPEVRDFEPEADHFPGYFADQIVSVGKSYTDKIPLKAVALALAAFHPDVKAEIKARNLAAPVVASILRRAQTGLKPEDFASDAGHRSALDPEAIDLNRVIEIANAMTLEDIVPRVVMGVEAEPGLSPMANVFAPLRNETVYTTPTSIARQALGTFHTRTYRLRAAVEGSDSVTFEWRVLAGDEKRIRITPLDEKATRVEVTIPWHTPFATAEGETTARVDIGLFARKGDDLSSPAVFSLAFPQHQKRVYSSDGRIQLIDYNDPEVSRAYADPRTTFRRKWRDEYIYRRGALEGWQRIEGGKVTRYSRSGDIVTVLDDRDRPLEGVIPNYSISRQPNASRLITVQPGPREVIWQYKGGSDRIGERIVVP